VIADLHLDPRASGHWNAFRAWSRLRRRARVIVLGDLFEYWIGPGTGARAGVRGAAGALRRARGRAPRCTSCTATATSCSGRDSSARSAGACHPPGCSAHARGRRVLFLHGDELATQRPRLPAPARVLRIRTVRALARARRGPGGARWRARCGGARRRRGRKSAGTSSSRQRGRRARARHGAARLVCGHAHRFRDEDCRAARAGSCWTPSAARATAPARRAPSGRARCRSARPDACGERCAVALHLSSARMIVALDGPAGVGQELGGAAPRARAGLLLPRHRRDVPRRDAGGARARRRAGGRPRCGRSRASARARLRLAGRVLIDGRPASRRSAGPR
jgi:UDP-2,3-diacylglucosamine pyrophosphatase LpxH